MIRNRRYLPLPALLVFALLATGGAVFAKESILNSPHNLSVSGGGGASEISYNEVRVCVFCHTPHNAREVESLAPLWNRALPDNQGYTMYGSPSYNLRVSNLPPAPTGASRICLSCHDGTLALNSYGGTVIAGSGGNSLPMMQGGAKANLTPDLSNDHPISFAYTDLTPGPGTDLVAMEDLPQAVRLDRENKLQCTACHDPHDNQYGNFLVMDNGVSTPLCVACHTPVGWDATSPHYTDAGCFNCHATHGAPVQEYLLKANLDQTCFEGTASCHGTPLTPSPHVAARAVVSKTMVKASSIQKSTGQFGQTGQSVQGGGSSNLQSLFSQSLYKHPVGLNGGTYRKDQQLPLSEPRVECVDCHNAHAAGGASPMPGGIKKSLRKVKGVSKDTMGSVDASSEYEICYKCHSGSFAFKFVGLNKPNRLIAEPDQMKRFDAANPSFHPVTANRRGNGDSLLAQYRSSMTRITCSDCHNSDQSKKAGGNGPNGPHGSAYEHILMARYDMPAKGAAGRSTSCTGYQTDYALCFTCHSESYLMTSGTSFSNGTVNEHARHVVEQCIPCFACHDPHGVAVQGGGTGLNNAHLINFDRGYAASPAISTPSYTTLGPGRGNCTVSCHPGGTRSYAR